MEEYPAVRRRAALFGIHGSNDMKTYVLPVCGAIRKKKRKWEFGF